MQLIAYGSNMIRTLNWAGIFLMTSLSLQMIEEDGLKNMPSWMQMQCDRWTPLLSFQTHHCESEELPVAIDCPLYDGN